MGRLLLVARLVVGDIRRRPGQSLLLLLTITTATGTLAVGLLMHGMGADVWKRLAAATAGPDVVAGTQGAGTSADLRALAHVRGVAAFSGPFPVAGSWLDTTGGALQVQVEGRARDAAQVDRPYLTSGTWARPGGVVIERGLAEALGIRRGDLVTLGGRRVRVTGVGVTTTVPTYPESQPGLVWATPGAVSRLASPRNPLAYVLNLTLKRPSRAWAFAYAHQTSGVWTEPWQAIRDQDAQGEKITQLAVLTDGWLLAALAVASVSVLAGGRMAAQTARAGLLKAVGASPRLVALVLLAEYLAAGLAAAAAGLAVGWLAGPQLAGLGGGLLGAVGAPPLTAPEVALVASVALAVTGAATAVPALRGARTSTIRALTSPVSPPRRHGRLISLSARLPVPLLLGLRLAARRPRRTALTAASLVIPVAAVVAVLTMRHTVEVTGGGNCSGCLANPVIDQVSQLAQALTVILAALAAVTTLAVTQASVLDARRPAALARAFGARPGQVALGLATAQLLPALAASLTGIPAGLALFRLVGGAIMVTPPAWWLAAVVPGTLLVVGALTALPSWAGARIPVTAALRAE